MSLLAIILSFSFVMIAIFLSMAFKLGLGRDLIITSIRATIQLLIVGYILKMVFGFNHPLVVVLMLLIMITVAAKNAAKRGKGLPHIFWKIFLTISIVELITQGFLLGLQIVPSDPTVCHLDQWDDNWKLDDHSELIFKSLKRGGRDAQRGNTTRFISRWKYETINLSDS